MARARFLRFLCHGFGSARVGPERRVGNDVPSNVDYHRAMQRLRNLVFATSLDYARNTGGWVYNSRVMQDIQSLGWTIERLDLPAGFPRPDTAAQKRSAQLLAALPDDTIVVADQICLSPIAGIVTAEVSRLRLVMVFHHPIAMEEGLADAERARFAALECQALAACRLVVATSPSTAATLTTEYGVSSERIVVAPPGIDRFAPSQPTDAEMPRLLSIGAVIPRKGYHILVDALAGLRDLPWRLEIVGDLDRTVDYVARLRDAIDAAGLNDRVVLTGGIERSALEPVWSRAHLYVAASLHEGYGMAVAEAIARGLPTVTTDAGAVGDWLDAGAAIIVPPRSIEALREGLWRVLTEPALRDGLRRGARVQAERFPTWADAARMVHERLDQL